MTGRSPTRRGLTLLLGSLALLVAAVTAQAGWLFVIAAGPLGVLAASLLLPHRLTGLEIARQLGPRATVGDEIAVHLLVRNGSRGPVRLVLATDRLSALEPAAVLCEHLRRGGVARIPLKTTVRRRGVYGGGRVQLECGWPFGLVRSRRSVEVPGPLVVLPRVARLRSSPLPPSRSPVATGEARSLSAAGTEFAGVREYRPGDPARAIHWRSTARRAELVVRELHAESSGHLVCVLGARDVGDPPDSCFEALVSAAGSLMVHALGRGHGVSLVHGLGQSDGLWPPGTGAGAVLEALATVGAHDRLLEPLRRALASAPSHATVAILTANTGQAGAELPAAVRRATAAGYRPLVVVARADTWSPRIGATPISLGTLAERITVRTIARGEEAGSCLEG